MAELTAAAHEELQRRLSPRGITGVRPLAGGASSLTYLGTLGAEPVVVKVAPAGVEPVAHRDVLRQSRLMRTLATTNVPVPHILWEDAGHPPQVPPLYAMSFAEGSSMEPSFDRHGPRLPGAIIAARTCNAARTLARLHTLSPAAVGLGGEPVLGPADEVDRWSRTLQTVDPALVPGWQDVYSSLKSTVPAPLEPAIVHGDFRLGNLMAEGERITAVIDWEIWSIGDPRTDVGWFLINSDPATYQRGTPHSGAAPSVGELNTVYCEARGGPLSDLPWFQALACFKSAATWSLIIKHNRRRTTPDPELEAMAPTLPRLLRRARQLLDGDDDFVPTRESGAIYRRPEEGRPCG